MDKTQEFFTKPHRVSKSYVSKRRMKIKLKWYHDYRASLVKQIQENEAIISAQAERIANILQG